MDSESGLTPYELRVKRNIEENQRVLKSLGLLNPVCERKENIKKTVRRSNVAVKSRSTFRPHEESPFSPSLPARRTRRSSSILKTQGYDDFDDVLIAADEENTPPQKKRKIAPEPVFGPIEGVSVGDWWSTRIECSAAGVHRPTVAGIHGKLEEGCYSIALSGGYEDDVDYGEYFTYTGSGGRDLKGTKTNPKNLRTAPQTKDQVLEGPNAALALNIDNHRPVRVIRGYKLPSPYAPEEGYRYDGLYSVERCWTATGLSGFKVYKYALKRLPDQDPPPWVITNESDSSVQNGVEESTQDEPLEEENGSEDYHNTQNIASKSADRLVRNMKSLSKDYLHFVQDKAKGNELPVTENGYQMRPKGTSSDLNFNSGTKIQQTKSPTEFMNYAQNTLDETKKICQMTPARNNKARNYKTDCERTVQDSESPIDSPKDKTENHDQVTPKQKRTSNNLELDPEGTKQESKILTVSLNSTQIVLENKNGNEKQICITPKRKRSFYSEIDSEETKREPNASPDSLNSTQNVSQNKDETEKLNEITPDKKETLTDSEFDPDGTKEEPKCPADSVNFAKIVLENKDETVKQTQMTSKRKRTSSNSKLDLEGTKEESKPHADSPNSKQNFFKKDETENQNEIVPKRRRTSSNSKLNSEKTKQELISSTDSLSTVQNISDDGSWKYTQMRPKRNRRTTKPCCAGEIESYIGDSEINTYSDIDKFKGEENFVENCVNGSKLHEESHNGKTGNSASSLNKYCTVNLTPVSARDSYFSLKKPQTEQKKSAKSPKKVRFSPEVIFNDEEGKKYLGPLASDTKSSARKLNYSNCNGSVEPNQIVCPQENYQNGPKSPPDTSNGDSKKQTTILKYFGPVKKVNEKRAISRGILLRSNRRSFISNDLVIVSESKNISNDIVPVKRDLTPRNKSKSFNVSSKNKSAESERITSSYNKRNRSPPQTPLRLKECTVSIVRLSMTPNNTECNLSIQYTSALKSLDFDRLEDFLGWDWDIGEDDFLGFDLGDEPLFYGFDENLLL